MPKYLFRFMLLLSCLALDANVCSADSALDTFTVDSDHSFLLYHVNHFDFSASTGRLPINGTLLLDPAKPENSKISITIPVDKIDTGVALLDEHLRGKLFFDTAHFPTATFVSTKIMVTGKDTAIVIGTLTLHGISHAVTLDVKLNKLGINFATEKEAAGFTATSQIKRSDFDILTLLPEVGDEVNIEIQMEAALVPARKS